MQGGIIASIFLIHCIHSFNKKDSTWVAAIVAEMECWLQVSSCKQLPSSFTAHTASTGGPVLVLANGTPHLYCMDAAGSTGLLASVSYSCDVRHVSPLVSGDSGTYALCCLDNGHVIATSLGRIFSKPASQEREDIFNNLLSSSSSSEKPGQILGDLISVTIATERDSTVSLLQAHVVRNTLIVCRRSRVSGDHTLSVYESSRRTKCGGCDVPLFTGPPQAVHSLSAAVPREPVRDELAYRPAVYCVGSEDTSAGSCDASLCSELFCKLFGAEVKLCGSSVILLGCQNGHIFYSSKSHIGAVTGEGNSPREPHPFPIMYSLGQPVQSIHAAHLPVNSLSAPPGSSPPSKVPNSLILVGRLGKIVVCTAGVCAQRAPSYSEFHVPGPIVSSVLVEGRALLYTTLSEMRRVCLEESCIRERVEQKPSVTVTIPEKNFQVPSKMATLSEAVVLLDRLRVTGARGEMVEGLACLSLGGCLAKNRAESCVCDGEISVEKDESELAETLADCLRSLEATSAKLVELGKKRDEQNEALTELGGVVGMLCDATRGQERLFLVSHATGFENIGVKFHTPFVEICCTYSGATPLTKGWSFLVQIHSAVARESTSFSRIVPLAGLQPGGELTTRVGLEHFNCLHHRVRCYVHYEAPPGVGGVATPTSVTLLLSKQSFDLMDFLLPSVSMPRQLPWQPLRPILPNEDEEHFGHSKDISISMETVTKVIAAHKEETCSEERDICRVFLAALLSRQELVELLSEPEPELSEVTVSSYDGRQLCLQASVENGGVVLSVYTSSESALCEAVECVSRRVCV